MRQEVEAQVLTSHCALGEHDLRQILSDVIEEVRRSINKDIDGAEVLNSLLNAPWLHSLLKVYECLQRFKLEQPTSYLNYASGLSLQLVLDIASLPGSSEEAQELCRLLRQPHVQALLSAHDTVAQKDYDPVLPPMPEELPEHEEATRVVCLVKNKQPLWCENQGTGLALPDSSLPHAPTRSSLGGIRSQWATLKRLTHRRLSRGGGTGQDVKEQSKATIRRGSLLSGERVRRPPPVPPYPPPSSRYKPVGNCRVCFRNPVSPCRSCYANSLWEKSHSSPSGSSSLLMDDVDSLDLDSPSGSGTYCTPTSCHQQPRWSLSPPPPRRSTAAYYSNLDTDRRLRIHRVPCCGFRTGSHSLCVRTAPPSPMTPRHHQGGPRGLGVIVDLPRGGGGGGGGPPVELAKQESLDELRSAVQLAAGSMASGTEDVRRLGEKMAAATERASESARDNARALALLAQVVERLQGLVEVATAGRTEEAESRVPPTTAPRANRKARDGEQRDPQQQALMGATIKRNDATGEISIARVIYGGLADRSGLLHAGDRVIEVNGFPVDGLEPEQVIQVVARSQGTIVFKVVPISERPVHYQTMLYMRAMADYSPQQDPTIPCADAGMSFRRGDVLEIVDQTDALWWQAKKLPSTTDCAGLIPSSSLLKRKQREFWWSQPYQPQTCIHTLSTVDEEEDSIGIDEKCVETDHANLSKKKRTISMASNYEEAFESEEFRDEEGEFSNNVDGVYIAGFRRSMRLCRRRAHSTAQPSCHVRCPSSCFSSLASPYEEVVRYQRSPHDPYRLVVLLGPSSVGVNELRRRLLEIDPRVFQGAVPHTTRPPRSYEESGREYHFTTREVFENLVYNNRFLEYGECRGHFYGTSTDAVKDVLNSGKMCIIDIEPNAIQAVRTHELKAFIIYVKPPPAERLRETRKNAQITTNYYVNRPFKDEDFQETEEAARKMESHYSQFFDQVIVNEELGVACGELLGAVTMAQDGPQWVPASWIRPTDES